MQAQADDNDLFVVAQKAFDDGFYDVAMRYINQLFEDYPLTEKRAQANLILGQCYFFKSQYLKAYDIFQKNMEYPSFKDATLFWLGETYLKGSDYTQAKQHFDQLLELYPESEYIPQAYYSLGWMNFEREQYDKALEIFNKIITKYPLHQLSEDAQFKIGETAFTLKKYKEAIKALKDYVLKYPSSNRHADAYFYLAESYYFLENYLNAISYYAKAAEISFDNNLIMMSKVSLAWSYLKLERFTLAEQKFNEALEYGRTKGMLTDDVLLGLANLYDKTDEKDKALKAYQNILTQFPQSPRIPESLLGMANIYYQQKKFNQAMEFYNRVIDQYGNTKKEKGNVEKSFFGLAWSHLKTGNVDKAVMIFNNIKDSASNDTVKISALTQIADAYQDIEEYDKAIGIYDEILTNYPDSLYTDYVQYRQAVALLKMDEIEAAEMSFQSLAINFPNSKYNNDKDYYLAVAHFKKEDWITAKHQILNFIENIGPGSPHIAQAQNILALCYYNLNEHEKAMVTFQKIITNHPEDIHLVKNAQLNIAKSYYHLDQHKEAVKRFRMIINKYPSSQLAEESLIWLGDHYHSLSDFDNAIAYYEKFLKEFQGSDQADIIRYELARSYEGKGDYNQSVKIFNSIKGTDNKEIVNKAQIAIAEIFTRNLEPEAALQTYNDIIQHSPEYQRDAYLKIAEVYKSQNDFNSALSAYLKALNAEKGLSTIENPQLHFYIADTYELLENEQKAVEEYLKVPYLYPNQKKWVTKSYLRIGRIFEDEERWNEAKTVYEKIIDLEEAEAKFARERIEWIQKNTVGEPIQGAI